MKSQLQKVSLKPAICAADPLHGSKVLIGEFWPQTDRRLLGGASAKQAKPSRYGRSPPTG